MRGRWWTRRAPARHNDVVESLYDQRRPGQLTGNGVVEAVTGEGWQAQTARRDDRGRRRPSCGHRHRDPSAASTPARQRRRRCSPHMLASRSGFAIRPPSTIERAVNERQWKGDKAAAVASSLRSARQRTVTRTQLDRPCRRSRDTRRVQGTSDAQRAERVAHQRHLAIRGRGLGDRVVDRLSGCREPTHRCCETHVAGMRVTLSAKRINGEQSAC